MSAAEDSKTKILNASLVLFGVKGYSDTTTREIARESGLSEATLFNHFKDKASLFEQVIETFHEQPIVELEQVGKRLYCRDFLADLRQLATAYLEAVFSHIHILRIVMQNKTSAAPVSSHKNLSLLLRLCDHFKNYLAGAAAAGLIADRDYETETDLFVCHIARTALYASAGERTFILVGEMKSSLLADIEAMCPRIAEELFSITPAPAPAIQHP